MGYVISDDELPEEVRESNVAHAGLGAEMRAKESFYLYADDWNDPIELYYDQIPRLRAILDFIEARRAARSANRAPSARARSEKGQNLWS